MRSLFFLLPRHSTCSLFFFFNDTATTEIYTLSLHDALPISQVTVFNLSRERLEALDTLYQGRVTTMAPHPVWIEQAVLEADRKSTRLNSSHSQISYAVFCLKKKKNNRYD